MFFVQEMIFMNLLWVKYVKRYFCYSVDSVFVQFFFKFHVHNQAKDNNSTTL